MPIGKIIRLRVAPDRVSELDAALHASREQFKVEEGTLDWDYYEWEGPGERILVELFADNDAVERHDSSQEVSRLLRTFTELDADVAVIRSTDQATPDIV